MAGNKIDFNSLVRKYEQMAAEVDEQQQWEQENMQDEFMAAMESDPS